ncbi:MAG: hypothetical protein ACOCVR_03730 [Myxococcota bacterium]
MTTLAGKRAEQLDLPLPPSHRNRRFSDPEGRLGLLIRYEEDGVAIELDTPVDSGLVHPLHVHVRMRRQPTLEASSLGVTNLSFALRGRNDSIQAVYQTAEHLLLDGESSDWEGDHELLEKLSTLLEEAQEYLVEKLAPEALEAAERFDPDSGLTWFIYSRVTADPTGRVEQMTRVCPGLMVFIRAFEIEGCQATADALIERIIRGERLPRILDAALKAWIDATGAVADPKLLEQARVFVRLAGPGVAPELLWDGPPTGLISEHIPRSNDSENALWYRFMSQVRFGLEDCSDLLSPSQTVGILRFLSRHASAIDRRGGLIWPDALGNSFHDGAPEKLLALFVAATGRRVDHRIGLRGLSRRIFGAIHGGSREDLKSRLKLYESNASDHSFPPSPLSSLLPRKAPGISIALLDDPAAVVNESLVMGHCVSGYVSEAAAGECLLLHFEVHGQALTARVEEGGEGAYFISELAGVYDRAPTAEETEIVSRHLAKLCELADRQWRAEGC